VARYEVPLIWIDQPQQPLWQVAGIGVSVPMVTCMLYAAGYAILQSRTLVEEIGRHPWTFLTFGSAMVASAAACAGITLALARRYAFSRRRLAGWTILCFLSGPMGILTMLALLDWPPRVNCASCGKMRVVNRQQCQHCAADFPPPPNVGVEIFEA
jgi:hypothetical protein